MHQIARFNRIYPRTLMTMLKDYEKIFSEISNPKPSAGLLRRILARIESEKQSMAIRRKLFWLSVFSLVSLPLIGFSWLDFQSSASESGLFQLISLVFTDFSVITSHFQDFAMSVAEALPILTLAGFLTGMLIFVESFLTLIRNAKLAYKLNS